MFQSLLGCYHGQSQFCLSSILCVPAHVLSLCSVVVGHFAVALHGDPKISAQCTSKAEGGQWPTWEHRFGSCRWQIGMIG